MVQTMTAEECATRLASARRAVALTGAGISTAAGVPDFRGPHGLYVTRRYDPETVFDIDAFLRRPGPFYEFTRDFLGLVEAMHPTFTHTYLVKLEEQGRLRCVVTQNIDALHQRAGSQSVISVHGDYWQSRCVQCDARFDFPTFKRMVAAAEVPTCDRCGGLIKPDVVFFGEAVHGLDEAGQAITEADLVLVLGSSLTVYPAAFLPEMARCPVVVVNQGPVGLAPAPNRYFIDADLDAFFSEVDSILG